MSLARATAALPFLAVGCLRDLTVFLTLSVPPDGAAAGEREGGGGEISVAKVEIGLVVMGEQ